MNGSLLVIVVLLVLAWIVLVRPQRRRQAAQEQLYSSLEPGDEIVTAGGLYGTIHAVDDDELEVEIAPGTIVRLARRAVAARVGPEDEEEPDDERDEASEDEPREAAIPENGS